MKKLVYVTIALVALFAANSCKNKNNVPVISATGVFINRDTNGEGVLKVGTTLIRVSTVMGIL